MATNKKIRWGWIKGMYIYTIILAGFFGLGIIVIPETIKTSFTWPVEEPIAFGIVGSVYLAFGLLSILGLRSPLKFVPVLLLQLFYKSIWFIGVVLPLLFTAQFPSYAVPTVVIFATFIIGDLVAIPFSHVFAKESDQ
ncbi:MAG: hypothetical protein PHN78_08630 [Dehalococcoidales bacterium]|nr:hypothetical protein [Dehalococcoidales bacterium]